LGAGLDEELAVDVDHGARAVAAKLQVSQADKKTRQQANHDHDHDDSLSRDCVVAADELVSLGDRLGALGAPGACHGAAAS
jgi:hypothetical protein